MKKDFLTLRDLNPDQIMALLDRAVAMKARNPEQPPLSGKCIGLLFQKPSTRTRVSFEVGIAQLGGHALVLSPGELQLGRGETMEDTARTLSRYLDGIVIRTFGHETLREFSSHARIPVINGLSDLHHPCQILADLMTLYEKKGRVKGLKLAYIGDGNNICNSLIEAAALMEFSLTIACPEGFEPDSAILSEAAESSKSEVVVLRDPREAAGMADAVYTDVWVSMGQEENSDEKKRKLRQYQINEKLLACAKPDVVVLHCLPAHRGEEITDDVIDGPHSVVFDQAENRLHSQKALLELLMAK